MSNSRQAWSQQQKDNWYQNQSIKPHRDYQKTIVPRLEALKEQSELVVETYGKASYEYRQDNGQSEQRTYDLYLVKAGSFDPEKPTHVITGGTHGYEKGGVEAAILFAEHEAAELSKTHNVLIYPCVSPGPYEIEHRFTMGAIDPNRDAILGEAKSAEMQALTQSVQQQHRDLFGENSDRTFDHAADLHETPLLDQTVILQMMEDLTGDTIEVDDPFPVGMFVITSKPENLAYAQSIIRKVRADGHAIVDDEKLYGDPNREGVLLHSLAGTVEDLMSKFAKVSMTTESCGLHLHDELADDKRAADQLAVVRAMFTEPYVVE